MSELSLAIQLFISAIAGVLLASVFFGGLWWTVNRILTTSSPHMFVTGSFLIRTSIVLTGFWWMAREGWQQLVVTAASFLLFRLLIIKRFGSVPPDIAQRGVG